MKPSGVGRRARVVRGLIATSACLLLAFVGHARAGGTLPTGLTLAVLAVPLAALLITLADRRRGPLAIFALLAGSQLALHVVLQLLGIRHPAAMAGMASGHMAHESMPPSSVVSMVGAHALATAVAAAILAGAERVAFVLAVAVVDAVTVVLAVLPHGLALDRAEPRPVRPIPQTGRLRGILARRLNARRGPPLPVAG